jgi:hypothetical protein
LRLCPLPKLHYQIHLTNSGQERGSGAGAGEGILPYWLQYNVTNLGPPGPLPGLAWKCIYLDPRNCRRALLIMMIPQGVTRVLTLRA